MVTIHKSVHEVRVKGLTLQLSRCAFAGIGGDARFLPSQCHLTHGDPQGSGERGQGGSYDAPCNATRQDTTSVTLGSVYVYLHWHLLTNKYRSTLVLE